MIEVKLFLYDADEVSAFSVWYGLIRQHRRGLINTTETLANPSGAPNPPDAEAAASVTVAETPAPVPAAQAAPPPYEQLENALRGFLTRHGPAKALALLTTFGAPRLSEVYKEKHAELFAELQK